MVRALVAAALLVASLGAVAGLVWWSASTGAGDDGAHPVLVVGPGATLFDAVVTVEGATALSLLQATGLDVELETYPGMGAFVRSIEGHRAEGGSGWIYEVDRGEGWTAGDRSPADLALGPGDRLAWRWSAG